MPAHVAKITQNGQCEFCNIHDELEQRCTPQKLERILDDIRKKKGKYNCLIGISGGKDSSTLLYLAVEVWKLRPLVFHLDNGFNTEIARVNMEKVTNLLGCDFITWKTDHNTYRALNKAFVNAGVPDADIPYDVAAYKLMYQFAKRYKIKYILNGHDFREEGTVPLEWTYMDARYIKSVYKWFTGKELQNYPLLTIWDQIRYGFAGIKQIRPFHYIKERSVYERQMKFMTGWKDYGAKHTENYYTAWVSYHLLPVKFKIDKRLIYLSAAIRSGVMSKEEAIEKLKEPLPAVGDFFWGYQLPAIQRDRSLFKRYNFKKYKIIMWVLMKFQIVPYTFYKKYCR